MTNHERRDFLRLAALTVGYAPLAGCGGGDAGSAQAAPVAAPAAASSPPAVAASAPAPAPAPAQQSAPPSKSESANLPDMPSGTMQFSLFSESAQQSAPYALGYAFRAGDIPAGSSVASDIGSLQVTPRNVWPDGSLKFAQLAGLVDLPGRSPLVITLRRAAPPADAAALTLADLARTGLQASVGAGTFGSAAWTAADWGTPFHTWVTGPLMSSWIYRKPIGSDAHLVAWLEVRLYSGGRVEVLPWIENGYLTVPGPTEKSATYTFKLGSTQRFSAAIDLKHHQRSPLVSGTTLSYWLGADPGVTPRPSSDHLQATELVPTYGAKVASDNPGLAKLVTQYAPLQQGNFDYDGDSMSATGYQEPIGLLPQHDALYLASDAGKAYNAVLMNGYSAGRYPVHYRDEATQRPLRFSQHPTLVISDGSSFKDNGSSSTGTVTPTISGALPPQWDTAHCPSVGFLAYLLSGRWYFMEEVQFAATAIYLGNGDNAALRTGSKGLVHTAVDAWQTRSCAWNWRSLVQALCVTPDNDTALRGEFIASVQANIDDFHGQYVAQTNNPYGWIKPGESSYDGTLRVGAPWQQDFVTGAFGYSLALGLPVDSGHAGKLAAFFQWKAKSIVRRLGTSSGYWYINGDPYSMVISPSNAPDYDHGTGPWYPSDAAVYAATAAVDNYSWWGSKEGVLAGEIMPGDRALWGNMQPAIAYAVRFGASGALAAYNRITGASNWPALRDALAINPVWNVVPATIQPHWLAGQGLDTWIEIAGTSGAGGASVDAYSGFAFNEQTSEIIIAAAGGHTDSADNRVVSLRLADDAPAWDLRMAPSAAPATNVAHYADGKPTSRHVYSSCHYIEQTNRVMLFGVRFAYGAAYTFGKVDGFDLDDNTWDAAGTWPDAPAGNYGACRVRATGEVWTNGLAKWSPATNAWTNPITQRTADSVRWPIAHDSSRNQLFTLEWADGEGAGSGGINATRVPLSGTQQFTVTFNPSTALSQFSSDAPTYAAMDYDPDNDRFLFYCGQGSGAGRIYVIHPNATNVWDMSILTLASSSRLPAAVGASGVQNRFRYVPALKGFVLLATGASNLYFIRTA